jgi:hypothetical protein
MLLNKLGVAPSCLVGVVVVVVAGEMMFLVYRRCGMYEIRVTNE